MMKIFFRESWLNSRFVRGLCPMTSWYLYELLVHTILCGSRWTFQYQKWWRRASMMIERIVISHWVRLSLGVFYKMNVLSPNARYLLESVREKILKVQGEARMFNVIEKWWHDMMCLFFYIEFMIINYPRAWDAGGRSCGKIARDSWANIFSSAWSTVHRVKPYDVARCFCGKRVCTWCVNDAENEEFVFCWTNQAKKCQEVEYTR